MAESLIRAIGWIPFDQECLDMLDKYPKVVMIYPHTSFYDFALCMLYQVATPVLQRRNRILINPCFTRRFQWFLKYFGSIESTPREHHGGGATKRICRELETLDEFIFALSPKGSMDPRHPWRTGFYHIARELKCPVMPAGFDYIKKKFVIKEPFSVEDLSFEEACKLGKERLYDIVPCNPLQSEFEIKPTDPEEPCLMETWRWILLWVVVLIVFVLIVWIVFWLLRKRKAKSC